MPPCACDCASVADKGMGDEATISLSKALKHCAELEELDLGGELLSMQAKHLTLITC